MSLSLSDKIFRTEILKNHIELNKRIKLGNGDFVFVGHIKEFIKVLNEYAEKWGWEGREKINELAGEGLI